MEDTTTARPATAQGSSTADLVKHLSEQIGKLARDEVRLAQLGIMRAGKRAGLGIGMFSGGGLLALYGLGCLLAAAIIGLATAVAAWLGGPHSSVRGPARRCPDRAPPPEMKAGQAAFPGSRPGSARSRSAAMPLLTGPGACWPRSP